jgi:hypothetical protein
VEFNKAALSLAESFTIPAQRTMALNRLLKVSILSAKAVQAVWHSLPASTR